MSRFSKRKVTAIVARYEAGASSVELAKRYGVSPQVILNTLHSRGVAIRGRGYRHPSWVPSPEEIQQGIAEVQATWDEATRRRRRVAKWVPYEIPAVSARLGKNLDSSS